MRDNYPPRNTDANLTNKVAAEAMILLINAPWSKPEMAAIDGAYRKKFEKSLAEDLNTRGESLFNPYGGNVVAEFGDGITNRIIDVDKWGREGYTRSVERAAEFSKAYEKEKLHTAVQLPR